MKMRIVMAAAILAILSACGGGSDGGGLGAAKSTPTDSGVAAPLAADRALEPSLAAAKADPLNAVDGDGLALRPLMLSPWGPRAAAPPVLSASSTTLTLGGSTGRKDTPQSITLSLNTGTGRWPWSIVSPLPAWVTASAMSGLVDGSGTLLSFSARADTAPGVYSAVVTIAATVRGETLAVPLTLRLNRDRRKLLSSDWGIGFASLPGGNVTSRTVRVIDNLGGALPWTATSSAPWLTATASGTTGSGAGLTLSANPSLVPAGTMSYASVTLTSSTPDVDSAVVKVGLWRGNDGLMTIATLPTVYSTIVADKIRPYVYAHNGGTFIDVYNAHSGLKIGTVPNVGGALGDMTVSPDGSRLFVLDTPTKTAAIVDLASLTKTATWPLSANAPPPSTLLAVRTNGKDVLLTDGGNAYVDGKTFVTPVAGYGKLTLTASSDGQRLFTQDTGYSPASVAAYDVDYAALSSGVLPVTRTASAGFINGSSNGQDIAVNAEGTALFTASGAPYRCSSVDPSNLVLIGSLPGGEPYPNNVEVTRDGRVLCGVHGGYATADLWVHASNGALLQSFSFSSYAGGPLTRQLVVTPDGMTAVALTDRPRLAFIPLGAP